MKKLLTHLQAGDRVLADGAMGTMLIERGLRQGECPEALALSKPEILADVAQCYFDAGAQILQTNTFGGSPLKLAQYGLDDRSEVINRQAVEIVRNVVGDRTGIYGSCGPSGTMLEPVGDADPEIVRGSFLRQIRALIEAGVDAIGIETMIDLQEAVIAVEVARSVSADIPVMATMTFNETPKGFRTVMGTTIPRAAAELERAGADVIGSNCGNGIDVMVRIAREFREATSLPLLIQSNAGKPVITGGRLEYSEAPDLFGERAADLLAMGVGIIGGCCGTTPAHIHAMRNTLDSWNAHRK